MQRQFELDTCSTRYNIYKPDHFLSSAAGLRIIQTFKSAICIWEIWQRQGVAKQTRKSALVWSTRQRQK